jgi:GTPase
VSDELNDQEAAMAMPSEASDAASNNPKSDPKSEANAEALSEANAEASSDDKSDDDGGDSDTDTDGDDSDTDTDGDDSDTDTDEGDGDTDGDDSDTDTDGDDSDGESDEGDSDGESDQPNVAAASDPGTYSGFIAIVGKPNVGKSTLLNAMLGVKVAPTSAKPQTTRRGVRGIASTRERQAVFVDTPGLHKPKDALGKYMNDEIHSALGDTDAVIWVVDLRHPPSDEDQMVARMLHGYNRPLFVVGNKLDVAKYPEEAIRLYQACLERQENDPSLNVRSLSAQNNPKQVQALLDEIMALLPENPFYFPNNSSSDQSREQWVSELIRAEAMTALHEEIPYAVAVRVTRWHEKSDGMQVIEADVVVERSQQKMIVIGKNGQMLKRIGQAARKQLEIFLNKRIYLELHVEVIPDWRKDSEALRELGYE